MLFSCADFFARFRNVNLPSPSKAFQIHSFCPGAAFADFWGKKTFPILETNNTWHRPDPSFTYLLAFFMFLTGIAWGIASTPSISAAVRLTLLFVFVHFLAISLLVATAAYFFVGRLLGPGIAGLPGRRRQQGLFTQVGDGEQLEFGYCFDVSGLSQKRLGEFRGQHKVF